MPTINAKSFFNVGKMLSAGILAIWTVNVTAEGPPVPTQFSIAPLKGESGYHSWLASYQEKGKTAKFIIAIQDQPKTGQIASFTKGVIKHVADSQPEPFLHQLSVALGGHGKVPSAKHVDQLQIDLAILGAMQTKLPGGGFSGKPLGNWITMKAFLAEDTGEVYLNLNPEQGIGEFSMKDDSYAEIVLGALGSVL
jgi:hypothetical protein